MVRASLLRGRLHRAVRVHRIAQLLRWLEKRNALGRNVHLCPGLRIAPGARVALPGPEASESANLDLVPRLQGSDDGIEEGVDDNLSVPTGEVANGGDLVYEVGFGHDMGSFRTEGGLGGRVEKSVLLVDYRRDDNAKVAEKAEVIDEINI